MTKSIAPATFLAVSILVEPLSAWAIGDVEAVSNETSIQLGYQLESSVASTYVARGVPQYVSRDDPSSQTTLSLRLGNLGPGALTVGVWNATAMRGISEQPGTAVQLDFSATYTLELAPKLELSAGYLYSLCPIQPVADAPINPVQEATLGLKYVNDLATPSLFVAVEVAHQHGAYAALALARDVALGPLTLTPAVNVGLAAYQNYGGGAQAAGLHLNDVTASLDAKVALVGEAYALLRGAYAFRGTPAEIMGEADLGQRSIAYASLALGIAH